MTAFDTAWDLSRILQPTNCWLIPMLKPLDLRLNAGIEEALDDIEEQFDYTREEALGSQTIC